MSSSSSQNSPEPGGLLHTLLAAFSGVLFGLFLSKLRTRIDESTDFPNRNDSTDSSTDDPRDDSLGRIGVPEANRRPSPSQCNYPQEKPKHWLKRWKPYVFLLNLATFVAVVWYALITKNMWKEMQTQSCIQRQTAINSERAWVGLDVPITIDAMQVQSDKRRIVGHYGIKNFGHGPALKVIQSGMFVTDFSNLGREIREANSFCESSVRFATGTVPVAGEMKQPGPFGLTLFPGKDHTELIDSTGPTETAKFFRYVGCVAYLDQFQSVHWTQFCMERRPGDLTPIPKLEFCSMFNETDKSKEQPCDGR